MSDNLRLFEVGTTFAARILAMGGPLIVSVITARALGPEARGEYFLVLAYAQIAAQISSLGLQSSNTYLVTNAHGRLSKLLVNGLYVSAVVAPLITLAVVLPIGWPQSIGLAASNAPGPISLAALAIGPLSLVLLYVSNLAIAVQRIALFNVATMTTSTLGVIFAAAIWLWGGSTLAFLMAAAAAAAIAALAVGLILLQWRCPPLYFDQGLFRQGFAYALKAYLSTMFGFLMIRVGIVALQWNAGIVEVGHFSIAAQLTDGLAQLPATIGLLLFPVMLRTEPSRRRAAMWSIMLSLGGTMAVGLVVFAFFAEWIIGLLYGAPFAPAAPLTVAMLPQLFLLSLITVVSQYLASEGYPWRQVMAWIGGFMIQAVLSFWLTSIWSGYGVAASVTVSYAFVFVILLSGVYSKRNDHSTEINQRAER